MKSYSCLSSNWVFCSRRKNIIDNKQFKIGIVDNMFSEDLILNYEDLFSFSKELQKWYQYRIILQSKRRINEYNRKT